MRKAKKTTRRVPVQRRHYLKPLLLVALALGSVTGLIFGIHTAANAVTVKLESVEESQLPIGAAEVTAQPEWLLVNPVPLALQAAGVDLERIPLARADLVRNIGSAIEKSPWVARVAVRKSYRRLQIDVTYRRPVLCIPVGGGDECFYVDETGILLPIDEATPEGLRSCLVAEGIRIERLPLVGQRLEDQRVQAAARLAGALQEDKGRLNLLVILVGQESADGMDCYVKTRLGTVVHWGPVAGQSFLEPYAKIDPLIAYAGENGSLELPNGPYYFDLTRLEIPPTRLAENRISR